MSCPLCNGETSWTGLIPPRKVCFCTAPQLKERIVELEEKLHKPSASAVPADEYHDVCIEALRGFCKNTPDDQVQYGLSFLLNAYAYMKRFRTSYDQLAQENMSMKTLLGQIETKTCDGCRHHAYEARKDSTGIAYIHTCCAVPGKVIAACPFLSVDRPPWCPK